MTRGMQAVAWVSLGVLLCPVLKWALRKLA